MTWHRIIYRELAACLLLATDCPPAPAQNWRPTSSPMTNWQAVASSADGTKLIAAVNGGLIYTSTNCGNSWTAGTAPITNWASVASSANGEVLVAAGGQGPIYISTNAGSSWLPDLQSPSIIGEWQSLACSADGNLILAGSAWLAGYAYGGQISISTNRGAAWVTTFAGGYLTCVGCSADGRVMLVGLDAANPAPLSISTNWGASWFPVPVGAAYSVGSSADGTRLIANNGRGNPQQPVSISMDSGSTWSVVTNPAVSGTKVAISGDGKTMVACANSPSAIFLSHDSGTTWVMTGLQNLNWAGAASSADGSALVAAPNSGPIYTCSRAQRASLNIILSGNGVVLSWTVPSTNLALQETYTLTAANWADVATPPTLNYSNLQYEVSLPLESGTRFYRLASK